MVAAISQTAACVLLTQHSLVVRDAWLAGQRLDETASIDPIAAVLIRALIGVDQAAQPDLSTQKDERRVAASHKG